VTSTRLDSRPRRSRSRYHADGSMVLRSPQRAGPYPATLGERLRAGPSMAPGRVFLGERAGAGWRDGELRRRRWRRCGGRRGAAARGLGPRGPLMVLSDNGVDNALLQLAAMHVGVPAVPVSPAYSLISQDLANLRHIAAAVPAGLVYAADGARFARALAAIARPGPRRGRQRGPGAGSELLAGTGPKRQGDLEAADGGARGDRAGHGGQDPVHVGVDGAAQGGAQHAADAVLEPAGDRAVVAVPARRSRRCWSTGCRGTTRSAATTILIWCCSTAGRSTSTTASRRRV
jgi:hypothetical protein